MITFSGKKGTYYISINRLSNKRYECGFFVWDAIPLDSQWMCCFTVTFSKCKNQKCKNQKFKIFLTDFLKK